MATYLTPEHFVELIQRDHPDQKVEFVKPIDLIIEGDCSSTPGLAHVMPTVECPMNVTVPVWKGNTIVEPSRSWLHAVIERYPQAKRVLLISECCGGYPEYWQQIIRQAFPDIEWVIPEVPDFCRNLFSQRPDHTERLIRSLVEQEILAS